MKRLTAAICAIALLAFLQALLMPKYMAEQEREGALIGEYYDIAGGNDVVFIGDCEVYENFSPIALWQEYGITSCIRGSPQQTIWQSYYLMEETFRYEKPKVMVFNVLSLQYDTVESTGDQDRREAYNRVALDGMRWSSSKWKSIVASQTRQERQWEGMMSYLFPILRYHDRWSQLTGEDFRYLLKRERVSDNGYLMQTDIRPLTDAFVQPPRASYEFGERAWDYLDKMVELCQQQGTELVLVKAPSMYPVWWWEWEAQVEAYAEEKGLLYVNLLENSVDIGIDWSQDTYDGGLHLNVWGAEKTAVWFGRILAEECAVPDRRQEAQTAALWAEKVFEYELRKERMLCETIF